MKHQKFDSISDAHRAFGLPKPRHPLISLIGSAGFPAEGTGCSGDAHVLNLYKISYRSKLGGRCGVAGSRWAVPLAGALGRCRGRWRLLVGGCWLAAAGCRRA